MSRIVEKLLSPFRKSSGKKLADLVRNDDEQAYSKARFHQTVLLQPLHVYPLSSYAGVKSQLGENIFPSKRGHSYGQRQLAGGQEVIEIDIPAKRYVVLEGAIVDTRSPMVVCNEQVLTSHFPVQQHFNLSNGFVIEHGERMALVRTGVTQPCSKGIMLFGSWSHNWYHWAIEILPKLLLLRHLPSRFLDYPLLIPKSVSTSVNHMEFLKKLSNGRPYEVLEDNIRYKVEEAIWIDAPALAPPKLRGGAFHRIEDYITDFDLLKEYRKTVLEKFSIEQQPSNLPRRIFLARPKNKRTYNEDGVFEIFESRGFEKVYLEEMSVTQQLSLMYNAELIVGPTGAAWTNILFANSDVKGLCWLPELVGKFPAWSNLAEVANVDLRFHTFPTQASSWVEFMEQSYELDVVPLSKAVEAMFDEPNEE